MEKALREAGCRITRQRKAILGILRSTDDHPSARQVHERVRKQYPHVSLATVYNTLGTLARVGLIKVMEFEAMENRHETNLGLHINLICTVCGKIEDFEEGSPLKREKIRKKIGFEVRDYRMEYYGICRECRNQARTTKGGSH
jgi:Fe2+ or Zn2+ uptake regulation protein